jgi:hypothetical protein
MTDVDILTKFVGYGNPYGAVWFMGFEEADEWGNDPEADARAFERYKGRAYPIVPGELEANEAKRHRKGLPFTPVYDIMSKVLVAATRSGVDPLQYRNTKLFQASGETFQANLFPLGKPTTKAWPEGYKALTGCNTAEDFYRTVTPIRFPMLRREWEHFQPRVTICFGDATTNWSHFKELFHITPVPPKVGSWYESHDRNVLLCPFFDNRHMSGDRISVVAELIRDLS